jgi:hypothetical protein
VPKVNCRLWPASALHSHPSRRRAHSIWVTTASMSTCFLVLTTFQQELGSIVPVWRRLALRSWQADEAGGVASVFSSTPGPPANSITRASARLKSALGFIALLVINDVREFCCKWQTD